MELVGKYTNKYLIDNTMLKTSGQIFFFQMIVEQLNQDTPISNSYRIHNAYTILRELSNTIEDYYSSKISGIALTEVLCEAREMFDKEMVIKHYDFAFYAAFRGELNRSVKAGSNQSFDETSLANITAIYHAISNAVEKYSPIGYQKMCTNLLKSAIDDDNRKDITLLCECLVSSLINNQRTIRNLHNDVRFYFETKNDNFDINWSKWVATILRYDSNYTCLIEFPSALSFFVGENVIEGKSYKESLECSAMLPDGIQNIVDDKKYFVCNTSSPANDIGHVLKSAFSELLPLVAVIDFSSEKEIELPTTAIIFNRHRNSVSIAEYDASPYQFRPYKQYRQSISLTVSNLLTNMKTKANKDYSKVLRCVACISSLQTKNLEYNYLILWSATETLFRSKQATTTIANIKTIVPYILTQRYIYYLVYDFIKNCGYCGVSPSFNSATISTESPKDNDVENMCCLLRNATTATAFISSCEQQYLLLSEQAKELQNILKNSYAIKQKIEKHIKVLSFNLQRMYRVRNKLVHHSEVDEAMVALYKHLIVYLWESIRELSYASKRNSTFTLEEFFSYFRLSHATLMGKLQQAGNDFDFNLLKWEY